MTLSDIQTSILRQAAEHGAKFAPLPKIPAAARNAVIRSMLMNGLLTEVPAPPEHVGLGWRQDEAGGWIALRITERGLAVIGPDPAQEGQDGLPAAAAPEVQQVHLDAAIAPHGPLMSPGEAPLPQEAAVDRTTVRGAATAVIIAWEAAQPLDAALASPRAILARRSSRTPRNAGETREGTKQAVVLAMLRRPAGTTVAQVMEATGWLQHTVRGCFAGLKARHGIEVHVMERVRQGGPNKTGARGSYSVYQIAVVPA